MKAYTKTDPVFSDSIQITETTDPAHADNINAAPKQLLQNTIVNKRESDKLKNPEFEDYTGDTQIPDPDDAVGMIISGEPVGTIYQYIKASLHGILTVAKKALNIAVGRNQARVFASVADLDAWLTAPENTEKLNVGDNFYIIATDVPDYWWDGTSKQKLETQKVDLTTYDQRIMANANAISELNGKLDGLKPGFDIIVSDGMTDDQIDELVRSAFSGGIRRIRIYNDKTAYKFGHIGNFNIWIYGNDSLQGNGIAVDHWSGHAFSFRISYPEGEILVERLASVQSAPIDISNYTWTSGSSTVDRISDSVFINIGLLNVTCAHNGNIFQIPGGFNPLYNWNSVPFLYKQRNEDPILWGIADISDGYIRSTVALTDAYVLINASWRV